MKRIVLQVNLIAALTLQLTSFASAQTTVSSVRAYRSAHEADIVGELVDLLSIPNVASDSVNIRLNAARLIEMMGRRGIQARLLEGNGPPAIFGELKTAGATRTIPPVRPARPDSVFHRARASYPWCSMAGKT